MKTLFIFLGSLAAVVGAGFVVAKIKSAPQDGKRGTGVRSAIAQSMLSVITDSDPEPQGFSPTEPRRNPNYLQQEEPAPMPTGAVDNSGNLWR